MNVFHFPVAGSRPIHGRDDIVASSLQKQEPQR